MCGSLSQSVNMEKRFFDQGALEFFSEERQALEDEDEEKWIHNIHASSAGNTFAT